MAVTVEQLLLTAAQLPLVSARCPGTFVFEVKTPKETWVLQLNKEICQAYQHAADQPLPKHDCRLTYKTKETFMSLHVTKDADVRQQFMRGAIAVKGDLKCLGSIQGLLDEARARLESEVPTEVSGLALTSAPAASTDVPSHPDETLYVRVLCSQVVRDQSGGIFGDLQDKRHVEYVLACSYEPFLEPSSSQQPLQILGSPGRHHVVRRRPSISSALPLGAWTLRHRFSDFLDLNKALKSCGTVRQALPPKMLFGNQSVKVVKEREKQLEGYIVGVLAEGNAAQQKVIREFLQCHRGPQNTKPDESSALAALPSSVSAIATTSEMVDVPAMDRTTSGSVGTNEAVDQLQADLKCLEQKCRDFERQSYNGFAVLLLALARVLHVIFALGCAVGGICLFHFVVRHIIYIISLGSPQEAGCPPPSSHLFSAIGLAMGYFPSSPSLGLLLQPLLDRVLDVVPSMGHMVGTWGYFCPIYSALDHYLWPISIILGIPSAAVVHSIFKRRILVFITAGIVIASFKLTRMHATRLSSQDSDDLWEYVFRVYAIFIYRSILRLKGIWVKSGQYIGSRADVMPQPIIDEFVKLQDAVPPSPFPEIRKTIETSFRCHLSDIFDDFDENALAAASIAQVHVAKLKDGRKVVVKVQHAGVRELMLEDMWSLWTIVRFVAWAEPEYDFRPIIQELIKHVEMELDFEWEVRNLKRAHRAMKDSGLNVVIPKVIEAHTATRVCVMEYCPGIKVTDAGALNEVPNKEELMKTVCQSFAYQMHIDGLFNADPHPGNILLQVDSPENGNSSVRPVLLDWGLAKVLEDQRRLAFAKFVYSAHERDFIGMLEAFHDIGIKLKREDPMTDMSNIRFLFRDTAPPEDSRVQFKAHFERVQEQRLKFQKATGRKNPVDAYPGDLLFFMRVTHLMHGLGSRLRVRTPYLSIMAPYAKQALIERFPAPPTAIYSTPVLSLLEQNVRSLLKDLLDQNQIIGCQVCVFKNGQKLVDTAAGWRGSVDRRPCTPEMLFCGLKLTSAVLASAVHLLADHGTLQFDKPVGHVWKEFANKGKQGITVRQVLTHQAWLQHAVPSDFSMETMMDGKAMIKAIEETEPLAGKSGRSIYHPFIAWILTGLVEKCTQKPVAEFIQQELASPLDLEKELYMGIPTDFPQELVADLSYELPTEIMANMTNGDQDGIGEMLSLGERAQEPEDILAEDSDEGHVLRALFKKLRGKQYLLDPRLGNHRQLQRCPVNGYFSARALAKLMDALPYILSPGRLDDICAVQGTDESLLQHLFGDNKAASWGLGFQVFNFRGQGDTPSQCSAIGQWGGGGSLVFTCPDHQLSFAMTVNKLSKDVSATEAVAQLVCNHFALGDMYSNVLGER